MRYQFPDKDPHKQVISDIYVPMGCYFVIIFLIVYIEYGSIIPEYMFESAPGKVGNKYDPSPLIIIALISVFFIRKVLGWWFNRAKYLKTIFAYYVPLDSDTPIYRKLSVCLLIYFMISPIFHLILYLTYGLQGLLPLALFHLILEIWILFQFNLKRT